MAARSTTRSKPVALTADMRIVVLQGPEAMLRKLRLNQLHEALVERHGDMDPIFIDGATAQLADLFDELREYSLLQSHKLVVLENAAEFLKASDDEKSSANRRALERYAENPVDHATLVLRSDTWRKGNLDKLIAKVGAIIACDQPTESDAQAWAVGRCRKEHGRTLHPAAAAALVRRVGPHLMPLDAELAKLALMVPADQPITADLVERTVRQTSEEQAWAVQEAVLAALSSGRAGELVEKMHELIELSGQSDVQVGYFLADMIRKLHVGQAMLGQGATQDDVARELKLWGPRRGMFFGTLRKVGPGRVRDLLALALEAIARPRRGLGDPVTNLESFCVRLVDQVD